MKTENIKTRKLSTTILIGVLAATMVSVACSSKPKPSAKAQETSGAKVQTVAMQSVEPVVSTSAAELEKAVVTKPAQSKLLTFKSRDYGVSFVYPYQYAYLSAKVIANGDGSLQPKTDGHEGQFTLARVEVPKGFYPDSNFDRGYFILSLNQDINEQECIAALGGDASKLQSENINGVEFRWMEAEDGGRGTSSKIRNYAGFTNGTCYEVEMGVKTRNEQGLARELNPEQVLRRLEGMLKTVEIKHSEPRTEEPQMVASTDSQN